MRDSARAVIIGGGIGGLSALYHLTLEAWTDVILVERDELTSGTTWHSAAQCPNLAFNQLLLGLRSYTIELFRELAGDPDYPINYHHAVGGLRLITDQDQLDACHHIISVADGMGVVLELLSPREAVEKNPLLNPDGLLAALYDPLDGDIDPAQLCQALARRARRAGAEIQRHNPVEALTQRADNGWIVHTRNGDIRCEHIVNAAGYRANEVGKMIGVEYPIVSMEHMYFVTEPIDALRQRETRVAMVRCPRDRFYLRQEKQGLLVGIYEQDCKTFGVDGIDPGFVNALCPNDLDRCLADLEPVFVRLPCLQEAGIQSMVTGPITYTADAGPLVGKTPGRRNCWQINGLRVGIGEGGGYGKMLAQMMTGGQTDWDCWQLDPRRIPGGTTLEYTALKAIEDYRHEFQWHLPHEHRPAGRPQRTTSLYSTLQDAGATFGVVNGWERVAFFKPAPNFVETHGYRLPNWHDTVEAEVKSLADGVGIAEISGFNIYCIRGKGAAEWLERLSCSPVPSRPGKVGLCYFLNRHARVEAEATLARLEPDCFWYCSAAAAEQHDWDRLHEHLAPGSDIEINRLTGAYSTLVLAGVDAPSVLDAIDGGDGWGKFPKMSLRSFAIAGHEVVVMSVSYSGEQAFEIHIHDDNLVDVYQALLAVGKAYRIGGFGAYAIDSMRLECGYAHWKADLLDEFNPIEAGLSRHVALDKAFVGRDELIRQIQAGARRQRMLLEIDCEFATAQAGETVYQDDRVIGSITSAAWGYRTDRNLAMAYLLPDYCRPDTECSVRLLGRTRPAAVVGSRVFPPGAEAADRRSCTDESVVRSNNGSNRSR